MRADALVLGAGIIGVSIALHLQKRGRQTVLIDRRGAAEETSYGNAGLIQREGVYPYGFPHDLAALWSATPGTTPSMRIITRAPWRIWRRSSGPTGGSRAPSAMPRSPGNTPR